MATKDVEKNDLKTFTLKDGTKLEIDLSQANGHLLMKCRQISGGMATIIYIMSEIATFNGEKIPAPEILNWSMFKITEIEQIWDTLSKE